MLKVTTRQSIADIIEHTCNQNIKAIYTNIELGNVEPLTQGSRLKEKLRRRKKHIYLEFAPLMRDKDYEMSLNNFSHWLNLNTQIILIKVHLSLESYHLKT